MKVWKKLQVVFLALLLCTGMMTQPALAASLLQDGIEAALTTDKETYQQGEEIKVTLTVTNTNDTAESVTGKCFAGKFCAGRKYGDNKKDGISAGWRNRYVDNGLYGKSIR